MKKSWIILFLLIIVCAGIVSLRQGLFPFAVPSPAPPGASEEATPPPAPPLVPEADATAEPKPTQEPTPEPAPEPTPRPLNDPQLTDTIIDASFFEPASEQGTVEKAVYLTKDYAFHQGYDIEKNLEIYLPYGYPEAGQYNVLFLLHPRCLDETYWFGPTKGYRLDDGSYLNVRLQDMLDNLVQRGLCEPMIVVSVDGYPDYQSQINHVTNAVYPQMLKEFRNDLLPWVVEHYATFAAGTDPDSLVAARRHVGVLGCSFGAYLAETSFMVPSLDLASWYTLCGGGTVTQQYVSGDWSRFPADQYPVDLLYFVEGEWDDLGPVWSSYEALSGWTERFTRDENLRFLTALGSAHEERSWLTAIFDSAQVFFRGVD